LRENIRRFYFKRI